MLPQSSVDELPNTEQPVATKQLVAAAPTSDPMSSIMKRLDEIETQLKAVVSSKKWDRSSKLPESRQRFQNRSTDQSQAQSTRAVVCFWSITLLEDVQFVGGQREGGKQPFNAVNEATNKNTDSQDAIPTVSYSVTMDYHLQGTIKGVPARFLVDTGATMSILNKNIWDRLNQHNDSQPLTAITDKKS